MVSRLEDCMTQTQCFLLAHIGYVDQVRNALNFRQQIGFVPGPEQILEFEAYVEVILDRRFAAARYDTNVPNSRTRYLFHCILNERCVNERQHLLWERFGRGKKAGSQTCCRQHCFADGLDHWLWLTPTRTHSASFGTYRPAVASMPTRISRRY